MFLIQEYCDSGSLFTAITTGMFHRPDAEEGDGGSGRYSVDLEGILSVATDIASGCLYIHRNQIIHGDLKPDNVRHDGFR